MDLLTPEMVSGYADHLKKVSVGYGASYCLGLFKKVIACAVEEGMMKKNPAKGIVMRMDRLALRKSILTLDEVKTLAITPYEGGEPDIRRAFLFSLYTGIRWCDVRKLKYSNVDFATGVLKFEQSKIAGRSKNSGVVTPLSPMILKLIGQPPTGETLSQTIFTLPSSWSCNYHIGKWVAKAGIPKHITWHCARHSFAVNVLNGGANIKTVQALMGHASIEMTEKYLHVVDELKHKAINSLPEIDIAQ